MALPPASSLHGREGDSFRHPLLFGWKAGHRERGSRRCASCFLLRHRTTPLFTWCVFWLHQVTGSPTDVALTLHMLFPGLGTLVWHLPLCWVNWCIFLSLGLSSSLGNCLRHPPHSHLLALLTSAASWTRPGPQLSH